MKNKNIIIKIIFTLVSLGLFLYANAFDVNVSINEIKKEWDNTLNVNFDAPMPDTWLSWEVKVFKDLLITNVSKDNLANNKVTVSLEKDLVIWSTYNIFSVFGVDWSADFIVENTLNTRIISQIPDGQWITRIILKDRKNLEVEFRNPLVWNEFEFKLLEDLSVTEISALAWNLILKTSSLLENNVDYILILISLMDNQNNNYVLNESIYDFNLWSENLVDSTSETKEEKVEINNMVLDNVLPAPVSVNTTSWTTDLQNWSWSLWNLENIAIKADETPNSWPETWILMFLTLIINSIYFLTRKLSH